MLIFVEVKHLAGKFLALGVVDLAARCRVLLIRLDRDKELRFPVRNSPDYKSLKISVFNDDKKTDLIGETTLRLDKILVKGGGTDDGWRGLKCKEKYAGEILVELTFWDMRPKDGPVVERKRPEQNSGKEKEREREAPRKVGGAREMANPRDRTVSRRPLPADPTRSSREDASQPVAVPEKRTRRSRHSYHPGVENQQHHPHHSIPEPLPSHYRDNRAPPRGIAMAPDPSPTTHGGIYDPSGDSYIPGGDMFGRFEEDNGPHGQPPPPPPPAHRRPYDASPGYHSPIVPAPPHQTIHKRHQSQHQLKHYQSVPDWQHRQQHSQDPDGRELYRSSSYDPRIPEQFSGSYPGLQNRYPPQDEHDEYSRSADTRASVAHLRQGGGMVYQDESPGLSHGPTPASSFENFGMDVPDDAPPPPPPPHGHSPVPMRFDEPNWGNLKPKAKSEDDLGLPSYELSTQLAHRRSYSNMDNYELERRRPSVGMDISLTRNGMPIPPSLVPGIDPVVAEQMAVREGVERRSSFVGMSSHPLQIEGPPQTRAMQHSSSQNQNYHRPQVEEVQDVQLYQPQLLPEDQVIGRPVTVKKGRERTAPMVKPMPIHGERDDAVPAIGATPNSVKRNATLVMVVPDRKPVPQKDPPFEGLPFSPDSFDLINPGPSAALEAVINGPGATYNTPQEAEETSRRRAAESKRGKLPNKMIMPGSKRVLDGSDVLPPESFAPEPEKRGGRKPRPPPPVPAEYRRHSTGRGRSPSPQPPRRGERLALTGPEPAPPPIPKKVSIRSPSPDPDRGQRRERAKLQKKLRNSQSMAVLPSNSRNYGSSRDRYSIGPGAMVMYNPESERERQWERERDSRALVPAQGNDRYGYNPEQPPRYASGGGGMDVGWQGGSGSRPSQALPPVPAKIPMQQSSTATTTTAPPPGMSREDFLLSQEMSLIDIGPSSGGRTRRGRY